MGSSTTVGGCYTLELSPTDQIEFYGVFDSIMISFGHCTFNLIGSIHKRRINVYFAICLSLFQFISGLLISDSPVDYALKSCMKSNEKKEEEDNEEE